MIRAQFEFDEKLTRTLEQLKVAIGASSKAEVIRRAVALLKIVQDARGNGEKLFLRREDKHGKITEREIIIG